MGQGRLAAGEKKAIDEHYTPVWVDESGFYLLPAVVRTYAPVGQTPIIRSPLTNDHLSAISAITPAGQLYMWVQDRAINSDDVVVFLHHLLGHIEGKILVLWDSSPIHRAKKIQAFLANGAAARIHLERLPAYAPEPNPDEGIWRHLKRVELRNRACRDLSHLRVELRKATQHLRNKPDIIKGCIRQPGYIQKDMQRSVMSTKKVSHLRSVNR